MYLSLYHVHISVLIHTLEMHTETEMCQENTMQLSNNEDNASDRSLERLQRKYLHVWRTKEE